MVAHAGSGTGAALVSLQIAPHALFAPATDPGADVACQTVDKRARICHAESYLSHSTLRAELQFRPGTNFCRSFKGGEQQ